MINKTKRNKNINPSTAQTSASEDVIDLVDVSAVKNRVSLLSQICEKSKMLDHLPLLFDGITQLSDGDVLRIATTIHTHMGGSGIAPSKDKIIGVITQYLDADKDWVGRNYVGEENGQIFVLTGRKKDEKMFVSNFVLEPLHTVTVQGADGKKYHMFQIKINDDPKTYSLRLTSDDFNKLETLQAELGKQLPYTSANLNGCGPYLKDIFHKYVSLSNFTHNQQGTNLLGLERFETEGPKYFCSPTGIYGLDGKTSSDIVFMGNEQSNQDELGNLTNLEYDVSNWRKEIAPTVLKNIININEKTCMMSLVGWMGALPHDYVVRKEGKTGFFPHAHIVGEPGSGKSTIMTILKQLMGHNDSSPRTFPTAFEVSKLLNSSYTIPVVLDEYGKRWNSHQTESMNKVLVEAFTKARWSRGQANLGSVYFKYKNPILMGGQIPTSDQALAARLIPATVYKSYQNTDEGKKSFQYLANIQNMPDKNFWVGYNLWCAQFSNEEVQRIYNKYRQHCRNIISENRVADIYAIVMLGLHFMKKLANELGVTESMLGYTDSDIEDMAHKLNNAADDTDSKETPLSTFLQELASYSLSVGNSSVHGNYFGKGLSVMSYVPPNAGSGVFGGSTRQNACVFGKELILIKIEDIVRVLNKGKRKDSINEKEIMTFINAEFKKSMQNPDDEDNLVLAPKQYKTRYGMYTAFSKSKLLSLYSEFEHVVWSDLKS